MVLFSFCSRKLSQGENKPKERAAMQPEHRSNISRYMEQLAQPGIVKLRFPSASEAAGENRRPLPRPSMQGPFS